MGHQPYFFQHAMKSAQSCKHLCLDRRQATCECLNLVRFPLVSYRQDLNSAANSIQCSFFRKKFSQDQHLQYSPVQASSQAVSSINTAIQSHSLLEGMLIGGIN